ncbi:PAS domain S-box protein [Mariprofundus sp. EBB-1]|uniref:PAS domain S-box protein n=1 Tax=Mariprofundus sp. EBB-1 TaxID=2650971 RepID=UPI000EF236DB|nr:PAS domain S-box protein [Mariprofundus sp. EBB-1]RLL52278.1 PAS domain S-box protein [Mariprofundus sp. EBB-1]
MNRNSTSIQRQLQLFFVVTLTLTMMIMGGVWLSYNQVLLEEEAERVLIVESDIIGAAARPALMFNDQRMARDLLQAIKFDQDVTVVKLFTYDGNALFTYKAAGDAAEVDQSIAFQKHQSSSYQGGKLHLYRVVEHKGKPVGVIYLQSNLTHLQASWYTGLIIVVMVMIGCLLMGLLLAWHLQKRIARPISALAKIMREMGSSQNYMLRADEMTYNSETKDLLVGFNQMAEKIQQSFQTIEQNHVHLKESEARFRNIVELAPVPVIITRRDGFVLFHNRASTALFDIDDKVGMQYNTSDFYRYTEDRQRMLEKLQQDGELHSQELEVLKTDGSPFWISLSMTPMFFENEQVLFSAFVDITDQKTVEQTLERNNLQLEQRVVERTEALQVAKNELQSTLDNMIDTYYRLRPDGVVQWASASVYALLGYESEEITGLTVRKLLIEDKEYLQVMSDFKEHDSAVIKNLKLKLKHKLGHSIWISASVHIIVNKQGEPIAIEGVARDISEVVKAEKQKYEMESKMAHVQRLESLGVLAGGIAHDFNNILAGVMGNAELAKLNMQEFGLPEQQELTNILEGSNRAADLCKQMLDYSGQGGFINHDVNMTLLVEKALQLIDITVPKNISLNLDLSNSLPPVFADKTQMQQVIMNLVSNAAESIAKEKMGSITISTRLIEADQQALESRYIDEQCKPGAYVLLEVRDDGCGMDSETQSRLFEPFYTTKFAGRGLGMSAVLGIVRSHNGSLQLSSAVGSGTCFKVLLPVSHNTVTEDVNIDEGFTSLGGDLSATVLVIDDELMVRTVVERLLNRLGCKVILAADGKQGIEAYQHHKDEISIVLLDMMMPVMGGKETLKRLKALNAALPIYICSGYGNENISDQFNAVQPDGIVLKPFTLKRLTEVLEINTI